jgi:hypothetical protein
MKSIYSITNRSAIFWSNLFTPKNDGIINFCKVEYGNDWKWAYSYFLDNKTLPKTNTKEVA